MTHEGNPGIKNVKHAQTYYYYTLDAADLTATSVITQDFCLFKLKFNADVVRWCHWENQCLLSKTYGTSVTGTFHNSYLWYDSIQVYRCDLMQIVVTFSDVHVTSKFETSLLLPSIGISVKSFKFSSISA